MAEAIEFEDEEKGKFIMITTFPDQISSQTHNIQIPGIQLPQNQSDITFIKTELDLPMFDKNIENMHEDNSGQLIEILSPNANMNDDTSIALSAADDIFQVDKSDLIQTSNFGDFNSNDENFFNDFNFDDMWIPGAESFLDMQSNMTSSTPIKISTLNSILQQNYRLSDLHHCDNNNSNAVTNANEDLASCHTKFLNDNSISIPYIEQFSNKILSPILQNNLSNSLYGVQNSTNILSSSLPSQSKLHDLLIKKESINDMEVYSSIPVESRTDKYMSKTDSCLSSSAPADSTMDSIWQRREPRKHLLSTSSITDGMPNSSSSTAGGLISPEYSFDEGFNSEDDSEHYEDCTSDSDYEYEKSTNSTARASNKNTSKKERFFWQYNVQSKGPKGQRLVLHTKEEDPHNLNEIMDPVFSKNCPLRGLKHNGKARKGDGNDLTPNAKKLCVIGRELEKLTGLINGISSVKDRPHTRKEKNKLASRACRLKKKAQHEANKIKLCGLDHEHRNLINGIEQIKHLLEEQFKSPEQIEDISKKIEKIYRTALKNRVAGNTTEYVNSMLANVKNGISQIPFIHS